MTWISYAQNHEDVYLRRALGTIEKGFYIDVGAHDPSADSVTRTFYDQGWCGLNVEPMPDGLRRLNDHRPRDINLEVAVGSREGWIEFHVVPGTGLSTTDPELAARYRAEGLPVDQRTVPVRTLNSLCWDHAPQDIHFLKIDTEGTERDVLLGLDLDVWRPWVMVVEATEPRSPIPNHHEWEPLILRHRYQMAWNDGLNRYYVAQEHAELIPRLAQPPSVFDDFMRATERFLRDDNADYAVLLQQARADVAALTRRVEGLESSHSWRITRPLRAIAEGWRRLRPGPDREAPSTSAPLQRAVVSTGVPPSPAHSTEAGFAAPKPAARATLVIVSPMPPEATGVADSCAKLLPSLHRRYDLIVVSPQPHITDAWARQHVRHESPAWLKAHLAEIDRVVYHLGNSPYHTWMWALMRELPGVAVVHDWVFSDVLAHMERVEGTAGNDGPITRPWTLGLYRSHGWPALLHRRQAGLEAACRRWSTSAHILGLARHLVFTSDHTAERARSEIGDRPGGLTASVVPLPQPLRTSLRDASRRALGLAPDRTVIASFGVVHASKGLDLMRRAWEALQERRVASEWVLVGSADALSEVERDQIIRSGMRLTGRVDPEVYDHWLASADLAVQLRFESRGESSGAALDALSSGLPVIVNDHGTFQSLPDDAVEKLPEHLTREELAQGIQRLLDDPHRARQLGRRAQDHVARRHHPDAVAARLSRAIEASVADRASVAPAIPPARQILVDVTALALQDLGTGIQRVTRSVLRPWLAQDLPGCRIEPVALRFGRYEYARSFTASFLGLPETPEPDGPVQVRAGDLFFGLDLVTDGVHVHHETFDRWRQLGVRLIFLVHDLLPVQRPDWFPDEAVHHYRGWLHTVTELAEGFICNSRATALDLQHWLDTNRPAESRPAWVQHVRFGTDLDGAADDARSAEPTPHQDVLLNTLKPLSRFVILTVGTIEPRKGHAQVLSAFEQVWADAPDATGPIWVVIGKPGWMVTDLLTRLQSHPERGRRLHWIDDAGDRCLQRWYQQCAALLMASEGEGLGLPLIEALARDVPVWARDIPVFREASQGAPSPPWFWGAGDLKELVRALGRMAFSGLPNPAKKPTVQPAWIRSWDDTAAEMLSVMLAAGRSSEKSTRSSV